MSLGIDDPVTREAYKTSNEYFTQLARQLSEILEVAIKVFILMRKKAFKIDYN